jgi:hypothetical protein
MRAAICFSGMPRNFKSVFQAHKNYIYNVLSNHGIEYDIFIHTWDNTIQYPKYLPDEGNTSQLIEMYQPTSHKVETYDKIKMQELLQGSKVNKYHEYITNKGYSNWKHKTNDIGEWKGGGLLTNNTISLFYGLNEVNNLRTQYELNNNFKYDIVIKTRFDNMIFNKLNPETLKTDNTSVYCPLGYEPENRDKLGTVNDISAIGSSDSMNIYMSLYTRLYELLKERFDSNHPRPWHTLGLTKHNLVKNKIDIKLFYLDHIVTRRIHKYKQANNSVVCGEGWNIPVAATNDIILDHKNWI